ncbi:MAG: type VI secretion system protein ImpG [Acidocella sp. 20-57-95]|nr:MAG: type VI secretion system protein ImpG [Acidocella sp. 20-57-95]HQT63783.1 type VI secretion system baseplate subunit TssF [Acidocella sp.]HQU03187.1 type VI secretion system baseplate subunit TssF [Acidocella sp.]
MAESLLPYFNRELVAIRRLTAEFVQAHPKIAGRLRLSPDAVDDPHVARLLDGVAFLSARAQQRLDDEFPELTDTLLGVLYPHFLAPFPSCAIAQFAPKPDLPGMTEVPSGFILDTEAVRGQSCRFQTAGNLQVWPVRLESARLMGLPFTAPANPLAAGATAVLRLVLHTLNPDTKFSALGLDKLRLYLRGGPATALPLFEAMAGHTLSVAVADTPNDPNPVILPKTSVAAAGFAPDEALLPWPARSFSGFRLLSEYFAFPQKFMFLDIAGLEAKTLVTESNKVEIFVYLSRTTSELERAVNAEVFALGCVPMVNLFTQRCEPINLDHSVTEYRVLPDARRSGVMEVWNVTSVNEVRQDTSSRPWRPFYRLTHGAADVGGEGGFYHEVRRDAPPALGGSDTFITAFDPAFEPGQRSDSVLSVNALCLNRDLPAELPFGGGHPRLTALSPHPGILQISCLTPPTPTLRRELRARGPWRLISHLSLGHLSVTGGAEGAEALKEVMRLYDMRDTAETRAALEGLVSVTAAPGTARVPNSRLGAFCRGLDVTLEFEPRAFQGAGLYLLASVLERFLALHATVNSFVRTTVKLRGRVDPEVKFPARAGARTLL